MIKKELEEKLTEFSLKLETALAQDDIEINNLSSKEIKECLTSQIPLQMRWEKFVGEASYLYNEANLQCETIFAEAFKEKHGNNYVDLSTSEAKYYASTSPDYIIAKRLENLAVGLKKKAEGVLESIESRKFVLKDLASLIIAGAEKYIL